MASVWVFSVMLIPAVVLGTLGAWFVAWVFSPSILAYLFGASLGVALSCVLYVLLLARSFHNWHPSTSEGGKEEIEYNR
jgi:hypothetical protein